MGRARALLRKKCTVLISSIQLFTDGVAVVAFILGAAFVVARLIGLSRCSLTAGGLFDPSL